MPTYEYRCEACKNQYEKREGFDAPSIQACPQCNGTARRVYHAPPIVFKGSGFYNTDNRRTVRSDANKTDTDAAATTTTESDSSSTDSKSTETKASEPAATE